MARNDTLETAIMGFKDISQKHLNLNAIKQIVVLSKIVILTL